MIPLSRFHQHLHALLKVLATTRRPSAATAGLDALLGYATIQGLCQASDTPASSIASYKSRLAIDLAISQPLHEMGAAFHEAGIDALLLKGEAWSRTIYPVPGVRSRCDCDVWVRRSQRDDAIRLLAELGFHEARPYACAGEVLTPEALFRGAGLNVDLHWQLSTLSPICRDLDFERCWRSSLAVPGLPEWRMLGPIESLLHAALHFACSGRSGSRWIWALDGLLLMDWAKTTPEAISIRAASAGIDDLWMEYWTFVQLLSGMNAGQELHEPTPRPGREILLLLSRAPWLDRARLAQELFWPRAAFLRDRYPDSNAPAFWLQIRRWLSATKKWARRP